MGKRNAHTRAEKSLRSHALSYPQAHEEFPWGHTAIKIKGKIFLILSRDGDLFNVTVKLPVSGRMALTLPFATPTGYGLGKSGWVTASFKPDAVIPVEMLQEWIDESFRAIAPKRAVAQLEAAEEKPSTKRRTN